MRRIAIALCLILAAGAVTYFSQVEEVGAAPPFEVETYFFSDPGLTNEIGWRWRGCSGPAIMEGSFSQHKLIYKGDACGSGSGFACYICYNSSGRVSCSLTNAEFAGFPEC